MDWSAPHSGFVAAAYVASSIGILGLVVWLVRRDWMARRQDTQS